jgi:4-diphosphocytidyl-2-C-methyl-D-erythritol kinase
MLTLFSPAKINLFLRILGKRPDGYHEIASLFQAIDLGDTLTFTFSKEDKLTCSDPTLPCGGSNLVMKAVDLFRRKTQLPFYIDIHLEKRIPTQAGLGGGSSNAATTLWALNALHNFPVTEQELQTWSADIGSDIPFFFSLGTAYCTGRGERVRNLSPPTLPPLSIFKPKEGISTPEVYKALQLGECLSVDPEKLLEGFYAGCPSYHNDLEKPAFHLCPLLVPLKKCLLDEGHRTLFMTGSGTALVSVGRGQTLPLNRQPLYWYYSVSR